MKNYVNEGDIGPHLSFSFLGEICAGNAKSLTDNYNL